MSQSIAELRNFAKAIDPAVEKTFNGAFQQVGSTYNKIADVRTAQNYDTELAQNVNLSMANLVTEQQSTDYEAFLAGPSQILRQYEYRLGTQISKHLMKFNKLNQIAKLVTGASQAMARRREFDITKLVDHGDATTYTHTQDGSTKIDLTGGAGLALQSASHSTTRSATSLSNVIGNGTTSNMDFAEDALEAAETYMAPLITDESDQIIMINYDRLFVSRKNSWVAQRLLQSTGRVGTPNNDVNLIKSRYELVVLPYIDSARSAYWALEDSQLNASADGIQVLESQGVVKDGPYIDFDTKAIKYSWDFIQGAGHNEWRPWAISQGDNT